MKHSTKPPTKSQAARFVLIKSLGCIACRQIFMQVCGVLEAHHLLSGSRRRGHDETIPLGRWHHQGIPLPGSTSREMETVYGPSLAKSSKRFREAFGSDDELLAMTNRLIGQNNAAAPS